MSEPYHRTVEIWVPQSNFAVGMARKIQFDGQPTNIHYLTEDKLGIGSIIWKILRKRFERIDNIYGLWFYCQDTGQGMTDRSYQSEAPAYAVEEEMHSLFSRAKAQQADANRKLKVVVPTQTFHTGAFIRLKDGTKIYWCDEAHLIMNEKDRWHIQSVSRGDGAVTFNCDYLVKA